MQVMDSEIFLFFAEAFFKKKSPICNRLILGGVIQMNDPASRS